MADQSHALPIRNHEVAEIVQVLKPGTDGSMNNPATVVASALSEAVNSQDSLAAQQDSAVPQSSLNAEKTGETDKDEGTLEVRIIV